MPFKVTYLFSHRSLILCSLLSHYRGLEAAIKQLIHHCTGMGFKRLTETDFLETRGKKILVINGIWKITFGLMSSIYQVKDFMFMVLGKVLQYICLDVYYCDGHTAALHCLRHSGAYKRERSENL